MTSVRVLKCLVWRTRCIRESKIKSGWIEMRIDGVGNPWSRNTFTRFVRFPPECKPLAFHVLLSPSLSKSLPLFSKLILFLTCRSCRTVIACQGAVVLLDWSPLHNFFSLHPRLKTHPSDSLREQPRSIYKLLYRVPCKASPDSKYRKYRHCEVIPPRSSKWVFNEQFGKMNISCHFLSCNRFHTLALKHTFRIYYYNFTFNFKFSMIIKWNQT